jgi:nucleoid DNA-binding protein
MKSTRNNLAECLREKTRLEKAAADTCAKAAVEWLARVLAEGGCVELRGLGTFYSVEKAERKVKFPVEKIVPAHRQVKFRPARSLKNALNAKTRGKQNENQS